MSDHSGKILRSIRPGKIVWPILIGLGATAYLFAKEFNPETFNAFQFTYYSVFWLLISVLMMGLRDFGYMLRIRILTQNDLSWKKAFQIIMLWEFTSAITPSAVGGTSVAIFFVNKEGIKLGRATGVVMITSFLDELFFVLIAPLVLLILGTGNLFDLSENAGTLQTQFLRIAWIGYLVKLAYIVLLSYGLFFNPRGLKWLLLFLFKLPIIRKWRPQANETGNDLIQTSLYFKNWPFQKWMKAFGATSLSWIARYWVVNTLIVSFFGLAHLGFFDHLVVFGKQLVMWIMMLVSPTPGGSGFAEYVFKEFLSNYVPVGAGITLALLWRLISYYPYLVIGAFVVPKWISKHFVHRQA